VVHPSFSFWGSGRAKKEADVEKAFEMVERGIEWFLR
jgi:hypothetical protein